MRPGRHIPVQRPPRHNSPADRYVQRGGVTGEGNSFLLRTLHAHLHRAERGNLAPTVIAIEEKGRANSRSIVTSVGEEILPSRAQLKYGLNLISPCERLSRASASTRCSATIRASPEDAPAALNNAIKRSLRSSLEINTGKGHSFNSPL